MNAPALSRWHRRLTLLAGLALLAWAVSGVMHPVMTRLQPQPVQAAPPPVVLPADALSPAEALRRAGFAAVAGLAAVDVDGRVGYRVVAPDGAVVHLDAATAVPLPDGEARQAETLARHATGETAAALRARPRPVHAFDADYPPVNRILPVWRVDFVRGDGLSAYVDLRGNRLVTLQDDRKRVAQRVFLALHSHHGLSQWPWLRSAAVLLLLGAVTGSLLTGSLLFLLRRRAGPALRRQPVRRAHRLVAVALVPVTLGFIVSGAWQHLHGLRAAVESSPPRTLHAVDRLGAHLPAGAFTLQRVGGQPCYRQAASPAGAAAAHDHRGHGAADRAPACVHTGSGRELADADRRMAEALARHHARSDAPLAELEQVSRFDAEYGFSNRRLPVWRARFEGDGARWYVHTESGELALRANDATRLAGTVFALLHKWQFIGHVNLRDGLLVLAAALNALVPLLGLRMWLERRRQRAASAAPQRDPAAARPGEAGA